MSPVLQHLFPLLLCLTAASGYTHEGSCIPWCRQPNGDLVQNGNVADPKNCYNYYICVNGQISTAFPLNCPAGYYFDATDGVQACSAGICDTSDDAGCVPNCRTEPSTGGMENLVDRSDCTGYYLSNGLSFIHTDCAGGQYFNGVTCQLDPDECCDPCLFYCGKAQTNIADPFDCTNYYYCQSADYFPDVLDSHTCPSGQFYDQVLGTCHESSDCGQLC